MRSSQDAQNVWGDSSSAEFTPNPEEKKSESPQGTGKTTWQANKNKGPLRSGSSFEDSQIVETPPHRITRRAPSSDLSEVKEKLPSVLKRPQTVDELPTTCRKGRAQELQRNLAKELEEQKQKQMAEQQEEAEPENNEDAGTAKKAKRSKDEKDGSPDAKPKAKSSPKAKAKAIAKAEAKAKANPSPKAKAKVAAKGKAKAKAKSKPQAEEESDCMEDHATAQSSKDQAKLDNTKKKEETNKSTDPPSNPKPEQEKNEAEEKEEKELLKQKKVVAHRLYMRFWRNIHHSPSPSSTKPSNPVSQTTTYN